MRNEEAALHIVKEYTTVPVPEVFASRYSTVNGTAFGHIWMDYVQRSQLDELWDSLDKSSKKRVCNEIWGFIEQLRSIPKLADLEHLYQCGADGSASRDKLLTEAATPSVTLLDDESLRRHIKECYLYCHGGPYGEYLPDYLPHLSMSVFTQNDLAPRNIFVDKPSGTISGLIDW
ncbi:hypothetical protein F5Y19DRAFT_482289 [Xylariaceae sp. FL1651]|nr:hypothetical protein F5Y19DRAFT_482289 [Xylariaceae sp. FL1651]